MPYSTIGFLNIAKQIDCQGNNIRNGNRLFLTSVIGSDGDLASNAGISFSQTDGQGVPFITSDGGNGRIHLGKNAGINASFIQFSNDGNNASLTLRGDCTLIDGGTYTPFTGSHIGTLEEDLELGTILAIKSVKSVSVSDNEYEFQVCDDVALPFGVYAGETDEGKTKANAVGEGGVLVKKETCGDIKAGDYLSSHSDGSAKKKSVQNVDKYTVAKALCNVEWEEDETEKLLPVVYLMG